MRVASTAPSKLVGVTSSVVAQEVSVGRQSIYDARRNIVAYELLFRNADATEAKFGDGDAASAQVMWNSLVEIGLSKIVDVRPAFLNCTRYFLDEDPLFTPQQCVLEVLENITIDGSLVKAVERLRGHGYRVALDDFVYRSELRPLVELANYIKVDVAGRSRGDIRDQVRQLKPFGVTLLAEKVESQAMFQFCRDLGFQLFQGYFLRRPDTMRARRAPLNKLTALCILTQCQDPDADFGGIVDLIAGDVCMSYRMLQIVNSALCGNRVRVDSIQRAVSVIGTDTLSRWATLLIMTGFDDCPAGYVELALQRAEMCRLLASERKLSRPERYYTVGLLSLLDAMLAAPLDEIIEPLPLAVEIREALLRREGEMGDILANVIAYESGQWQGRLPGEAGVFQDAFWNAAKYARSLLSLSPA